MSVTLQKSSSVEAKGKALFENRMVRPLNMPNTRVYYVNSETEPGKDYRVDLAKLTCNCAAFKQTKEVCKHLIAAKMYEAHQAKLQNESQQPKDRIKAAMAWASKASPEEIEKLSPEYTATLIKAMVVQIEALCKKVDALNTQVYNLENWRG